MLAKTLTLSTRFKPAKLVVSLLFPLSICIVLVAVLGAYQNKTTTKPYWWSGLEMNNINANIHSLDSERQAGRRTRLKA
ncbi:hypothetical protein B0H13DRAFT_2016255 [Mycena leptocephala]|nr:hypothetical protein B0H13DRAFT_2016255 [Mycena leptocephala]